MARDGGAQCERSCYLGCGWWAWAPLMMVDGIQRCWLSRDVCSEVWGQRVPVGDAVPCRGFLDGPGG
jgi:hypothetical protein